MGFRWKGKLMRIAVLLCTAVLLSSNTICTAQNKPKLKGLLVTGGCCHDYQNQKRIITEGLSQRLSIAWDIVH